jgi:hypothetical protein
MYLIHMSKFISALDFNTPCQFGENGTLEYGWSNNIREKICQINYQLTRTKIHNKMNSNKYMPSENESLFEKIEDTLKDLQRVSISKEEYIEFMSLFYRMIGFTRDIIDGKGEYALSYKLLDVWSRFNPDLANFALRQFVIAPTNVHPYGSWKDIKYIHDYCESSSLRQYSLELLIEQLRIDSTSDNPSLAAKWVPREKSKYGNLFTELATTYFVDYILSATTDESRRRAIIKAKMDFRKLISFLNKKLDTVQIKQCANTWAEIEPSNQTSITMHKQKHAFLNIDKFGQQRSESEDRIICANKFKEYARKAANGDVEVKGKRIGLNDFVKDALQLIYNKDSDEAKILNAQWVDNTKQTGALGKIIAMVDVSGSMNGDPMNAAIGLGIRVAEKSLLGKRVLTFSAAPSWINLESADNFIDMVEIISRANWGMNTNFAAALNLILDAIISQKLTPDDVEDMVLAIFSDMQIDQADSSSYLMETIEKKYADAGYRLWGKPFKPPHILFWNLRSTSGFPILSSKKNCSMMSGFSPALLNLFCEEGLESLQSCTPWSIMVKSLNNERYSVLDKHIRGFLNL